MAVNEEQVPSWGRLLTRLAYDVDGDFCCDCDGVRALGGLLTARKTDLGTCCRRGETRRRRWRCLGPRRQVRAQQSAMKYPVFARGVGNEDVFVIGSRLG